MLLLGRVHLLEGWASPLAMRKMCQARWISTVAQRLFPARFALALELARTNLAP
jgi:hypothetical protein